MSDILVRAIDRDARLRVVAAITTDLSREAAALHHAVGAGACALGRAFTSSLLLATLTKNGERVTVQIRGDGPLGAIVVDVQVDPDRRGDVRGYAAHFDRAQASVVGRTGVAAAVGRNGVINVVRDIGLHDRYQGQIALVSGEIDEDVEAYLLRSEQVPSALGCDVVFDGPRIAASAGVLVQAQPGGEVEAVLEAQRRLRDGAVHDFLARGGGSALELAEAAYGRPLEVLGEQPLAFRCRCTRERIEDMLTLLTVDDLDDMIAREGKAEITCNFCNTLWVVERDALERVRGRLAGEPRGGN